MDEVRRITDYLKTLDIDPQRKEDIYQYIILLRQQLPQSIHPLKNNRLLLLHTTGKGHIILDGHPR